MHVTYLVILVWLLVFTTKLQITDKKLTTFNAMLDSFCLYYEILSALCMRLVNCEYHVYFAFSRGFKSFKKDVVFVPSRATFMYQLYHQIIIRQICWSLHGHLRGAGNGAAHPHRG